MSFGQTHAARFPDGCRHPLSALGIDLGTTNSVIAALAWHPLRGGAVRAECVEIEQDMPEGSKVLAAQVPSVVAVRRDEVLVGIGAKALKARTGALPFRNIFYECKNDIGICRTYYQARSGCRSAREISSIILEYLMRKATSSSGPWDRQVVVTVPGSFGAAQRRETMEAARIAGLSPGEGMLLDEPRAAFIDYLISHGEQIDLGPDEEKRLLVFDFGGGTCDVAVFALTADPGDDHGLGISPLAVSRYYRIGGGDIDRAIVHKVLLPKLISQNSISAFDLGFYEKNRLEAPLVEIAEYLKIKLCGEIGTGRDRDNGGDGPRVTLDQEFSFSVKDRSLDFFKPDLTLAEFEKVMAPFVDPDQLYVSSDEYIRSQSIFAPLRNTLDQSGLEPHEIDYLLMVGGSSRIPQVVAGVKEFFPAAGVLAYRDRKALGGAVARGAAYQALSLSLYGRGILAPICHEEIRIKAEGEDIELVPCRAALPFPENGFARCRRLALAETSKSGCELRVEVEGGSGRRLFAAIWKIDRRVSRGEGLVLEYRMDTDQILHLRMVSEDSASGDEEFVCEIEHPLTAVLNSNKQRQKIYELEADLHSDGLSPGDEVVKKMEIASLCRGIGQSERALAHLRDILNKYGPAGCILNRMGIYSFDLGDEERAEKFHRQATEEDPDDSTAQFNLALLLARREKYGEALAEIDRALGIEVAGPFYILKADILKELGKPESEIEETLKTGVDMLLSDLENCEDWELYWLGRGAVLADDPGICQKILDEKKRRIAAESSTPDSNPGGVLPMVRPEGA